MLVSCGFTLSQSYWLAHVTPLGESEKDACPGQRQPHQDPPLVSEHKPGLSLHWPLVLVRMCAMQPKMGPYPS